MFGKFFSTKSESADSLKAKGNVAMQQGHLGEAETFYRKAIAVDSNYMPAYYNLGNVLRAQRQHEAALEAYHSAHRLAPDDYEILVNMGATLNDLARCAEAISAFDRAIVLSPSGLEARINKGVALWRQGSHDDSLAIYNEILAADPSCSIARYYRSFLYLLQGRWQEGFLDHEARLDLPGFVPHDLLAGHEEWDGADLTGQTLLIYPEQGMGDMIQFLRYASRCKAKGARVMVSCHPPLAPLLSTAPDIDVVVPDGMPLPEPFDTYISAMSLPHAIGYDEALPPLRLDAPCQKNATIAAAHGLKVGVCWRGNATHQRDAERSIATEIFWNYFSGIDGVSFFSFQMDDTANTRAVSLSPFINSFLDTASIVQQLDLIVTVDTSLAHLCGSLGVPTWILVTQTPDWRWGLHGTTSDLYPSVRLFRQLTPGNWETPLSMARKEIEALTTQR